MDMIAKDDHEAFKNYIKTHANNDSEEEFAFKGVCDDGANFDAIMTVSPAKYEGEDCTQLLIRTAGNSLELEQRLKELQAKDQLTGLYNQSFFVEKTQEQVNKYVEGSGQLVVTMAELDQFDELKNKFSLLEMDELIKQAGEVIAGHFEEDTIIGRVGEDGFVVLNTYQNPNQAKDKSEALCEAVAKHMFEVKGQTFSITISVGMAVKQENSASGEEMVSNAHAACLRARSKGGNNVKSYNPAIDNAESTTNAQILEKLQDAMENERLLLTYQPIVKLHGEPQGLYQVALDIKDEKGESLPLDELFPAAQSAGMAVKLERWMVSKAISSLAQYRTSGLDAKIIIPLSSSSLLDDKFPHFILECVKRAQVPTANLIFQLTEDIAASHLKRSIAFSNALQKLKCKLAITGFGASQECENLLSHLKVSMATLLPNAVDFLMGTEEENNRVHELIDMIHTQSIVSVICNVEDAQALAVLWPLGVHYIQGSYLQEPMPEMGYDFSESDF